MAQIPDVAAAYDSCLQLARTHYENFPVASWLMPPAARRHIAALYAFARIADDFADEGYRPPADRVLFLEDWQRRLDAAAIGEVELKGDTDHIAVFIALRETLRVLPADSRTQAHALLGDLLSAFRQDVIKKRYDTWADVLDYCRRSANPVGRLVLLVNGYRDESEAQHSDAVCSALQLTNFWQDLARDWAKGRLYVPLDVLQAHHAQIDALEKRRWTPEWRKAMADVGARTEELFATGRPVADGVRGRLAWELRLTWLGGHRILDRLAAADYDVFSSRPSLTWRDAVTIAARVVTWRRSA
ncbi:MAG TPA: squalene synthase HpnC [Vicinamibacterales bacterium]|nr:squalene synthase HpnC [Vicinamibacterales bacterium]